MAWAEPLHFGTQASWPDGTTIGGGSTAQTTRRNTDANNNVTSNQMRTFIADLAPDLPNVVLIGVVLAKQSPRSVVSRKYPNTQRYVFSFVLRDSITDFIHISCWGAEAFIKELANSFKVSDIVVVNNPSVQAKQSFEAEDRFKPWTSSSFQLSLSENHSSLQLYSGNDVDQFQSLLHQSIKEGNDYYTLEDVIANGQDLNGHHINLLVLVKSVGNVKDIVTKDGRNINRCEVKVFDDTHLNFSIIIHLVVLVAIFVIFTTTFYYQESQGAPGNTQQGTSLAHHRLIPPDDWKCKWDIASIEQTYTWLPKDTVLFFADVLIKFDNFRMCMTATVDSKTIIITNPDSPEAHSLYRYGKGCADSVLNAPDNQPSDDLDLSAIKDVYTAAQLNHKCEELKTGGGQQQTAVHGIMYAALTSFNIDGSLHTVISHRCASCKRRVNWQTGVCSNNDCTADTANEPPAPTFDMNVVISDHTGSVDNCRLGGGVAEHLLECTAADFSMMDEQQRTDKKWKHLLEICKIYFKLSPVMRDSIQGVSMRVLSCSIADQKEVANYIQ